MKGKLILEDGSVFYGQLLNDSRATGEVVFNTSMTGYQESLTDPSYCRQILTLTYPLVGNYGIADIFMQSRKAFVGGFVIGELCTEGSNWHYEESLAEFLTRQNIPCLYDVDTRAVTQKIRSAGTMKGIIVPEDASQAEIDKLLAVPIKTDVVMEVTTPETYTMESESENAPLVVAMDFGVKQNILNSLHNLGCRLQVVPAATKAEDILAMNPDGIFLSNGPGDPADVPEIVAEIKKLIGKKPIFGICLGHQLIARALGAKTYKLKFGHRGSNQPVKNLLTGKVQISSQNHGYAVDEESLQGLPLEVTHVNVNDGTVEGMRHKELPLFSVQYHPEASPGPDDNMYLFDEFWTMLKGEK
ncbi:MAG: glutamine-hydrolyzing carbamoyl-phosphate synthase small subunit [Selenomonas sp.]|uniref:glutamine-hydrolyzing carbamoyl-phosphate synthase small subunit n=1 Tax=Selenomonas sp. AE3005 TaxID=1485543 RepID=UPI000487718E|nr:glutamine-hydrolyzing carbamoyl-phosphate synthase small subunit [Selenomonas sp. AE3005]MBQ1614770.1 glutamine-hydrolyzing carbamoyl-phosphate synthase small subunit [Selenomonas sp.]MBQ4213007.1 glutamine-hydrolyzing carbamoyl-phosphate synthase small subunit [Selenomonas sp.]MBQ5502401.1 glutamine-hydrolyzing carbamoyl-phosphate synthase small subunit [Selenomonas sp.]